MKYIIRVQLHHIKNYTPHPPPPKKRKDLFHIPEYSHQIQEVMIKDSEDKSAKFNYILFMSATKATFKENPCNPNRSMPILSYTYKHLLKKTLITLATDATESAL